MSKLRKAPPQIVYLGENGFPEGFGSMQRLIMLSQSLIYEGAKVMVINRKGTFDRANPKSLPLNGKHLGIEYCYTSGSIYRPTGFVDRNYSKLKGIIGEYRTLKQLRKSSGPVYVVVSTYAFQHVIRYRLWCWWHKVPMIMNYVEKISSLAHRKNTRLKVNDFIYDQWLVPLADGAFPISQYLVEEFRRIQPNKAYYKIPIICDFEKFNVPRATKTAEYFCYCGALDYGEVIKFVLEAFNTLNSSQNVGLVLILGGGTDDELSMIREHIGKMKRGDLVTIKRNQPHDLIPASYKEAMALLIPMRPTIQDKARFPHKIGEYVASGNPMISCNYGEVQYYFEDEKTALLTATYDVASFAEKMQFVLDNPEKSRLIGEAGREVGLQNFDYKKIGSGILSFMDKLCPQ